MGYSQNSLISCIYDMGLRRSTWENVLDILSASLPNCAIMVSGDDLAKNANIVFAQRGLSPAAAASYPTTYAAINPLLALLGEIATLQTYHDDQLVPRETVRASRYGREWLADGDFDAATGVVLLREGARQLTLEVRYASTDTTGLRDRVGAILGETASHFQRAFEISSRALLSAGSGYLDGIVEDLPFSVFFVNEDMRIQYCNFQAESMRRQGQGPFSGADGVLRSPDAKTDAALRQTVQRAIVSKRAPTSILRIDAKDREERYLVVARLASRNQHLYQLHDAILDPGPLVMLIVQGSVEVASLPYDLLSRAFALTETETQLAEALLSGDTLADLARTREVSKQTLRNQLVGLMRKTGTRRQSELVALLTRLALTVF